MNQTIFTKSGKSAIIYSYDPLGNLLSETTAPNSMLIYAYEIFNSKTTIFSDARDVWNAIVKVYTKTNNESYIPLLKEYLIDNASKDALSNILDWRGY